ncbi:MAG: GNAT family N-acetyltransferase [Nanoarchaeota archaeon]|nr:GNAT family N-acetyltransferase [Nanoarchaeota archaeon]
MMIIRKAKKEDFEDCFKLELEYAKYNNKIVIPKSFQYSLSKKERRKQFNKKIKKINTLFLVMHDKNKIVGFFIGNIDKLNTNGFKFKESKVGYLENVFITKKYRNKSYFSKFMKIFYDYLKKNKIKYCVLHVDIKNKKVIEAYNKWGFVVQEYKMVGKIR